MKNGIILSAVMAALCASGETVKTATQPWVRSYVATNRTDVSGKADATNVYTKAEIDSKLAGALSYKGTKASVSALPSTGNVTGDVWHVTATGGEYAWNGSAWEELGSAVDLSGYVEESELGLATTAEIDALFTES